MWLQEIAAHQGLDCRGGVRTTNSPVSLDFRTLSPFGICIQKPGLSEPGDAVCRSYILRVQGWVIQMREKLEGQTENIQGSPVGTGLIELSDSVGREIAHRSLIRERCSSRQSPGSFWDEWACGAFLGEAG